MIADVLQLELPPSDAPGALATAPTKFVIGPENSLLVPPIERLLAGGDLAQLASLFNPLTLVGPAGSGKSHLVQGIVRRFRGTLPDEQIGYYTAADFGREMQAAQADERLAEWRCATHGLRLLVIEDLHRLRPRATIQQELRDAIDAIMDAGGLVIVTAQREPAALDHLDRGLDDRLAAGLTIRLQNPGPAARRALVTQTAAARGLALTSDQTAALAHRELGPAAQVIGSVANFHQTERSSSYATFPDAAREHAKMKQILAVTARYFAVTQAALTGPSRRSSLVAARNIVVHLARRLTTLSYADVGRALGNRDHTTIMHAQRRLAEQLSADPVTQQTIDELDRLLR